MIRKIQIACSGILLVSVLTALFVLPDVSGLPEEVNQESVLLLISVVAFFSIAASLFIELFFVISTKKLERRISLLTEELRSDKSGYPGDSKDLPPELQGIYDSFRTVLEVEHKQWDYAKRMSTHDDMRYQFITTLSHRLRTPITGLRWGLNSLSDELKKQGVNIDILPLISDSAENISELIEGVIEAATLKDMSLGDQNEDVDVEALVSRAVKGDTLLMLQNNITATIEKKKDIIPMVQGNKRQLSLALDNVISNAVRYSKPGGVVFANISVDGNHVVVSIADSGIGITPEEVATLFSPFGRGKEAMRLNPDGSGLGLYLTKNIIERHGGTITVNSVPGIGSTFTIRLPIAIKGQLEKFIQT